jgi:hypothetical protein
VTIARRQRCSRVKSDLQITGHKWILGEPLILTCVRNDEHLGLHYRMCTKSLSARRFLHIETEPRFKPLPIGID